MADDLRNFVSLAAEHFRGGNLDLARRFLELALERQPNGAELRRFLGVILCRMGRMAEGMGHLLEAQSLGDDSAELHTNLGLAYRDLGLQSQAAAAFRRAIEREPATAERYCLLADCLADQDDLPGAAAVCRQALDVDPGHAQALCHLGMALANLDRGAEAVGILLRAMALHPAFDLGLSNLGYVLKRQGRIDEAARFFARAVAASPENHVNHYNLACLLQEQGRTTEAAGFYQSTIAAKPDQANAYSNLGVLCWQQARMDAAEDCFRRAIAFEPDHLEAHCNLGGCLTDQERLDEAARQFHRCTKIDPTFAKGHSNLGVALHRLGRPDDAAASLAHAVELAPDYVDAHFNLALALLLMGETNRGWAEYEWRWRKPAFEGGGFRHDQAPLWTGDAACGRTMLLWCEQGAGDSIQMVRYLRDLARSGWSLVLEAPASLVRLFSAIEGVPVFAQGTALPPFDVHCPLVSLPHRGGFGPTGEPYLRPEDSLRRSWRDRLAGEDRPRVGIVWRGNPGHRRDRQRSIPAELFAKALPAGPIRYVVLQTDASADEIAALRRGRDILDWGRELGDYADSAALISCLDLVLSVDTSVCHLAGALGIETWTLVERVADWRWGLEGDTTPWYRTMRLLRQPEAGQWPPLLASVAERLTAHCEPVPSRYPE
jgi:tetratricopeptide (TPR) repeat protein